MSIGMTSFKVLYGYESPSFMDITLGDNRVPQAKDCLQKGLYILRSLKESL